MLNHQTRCLKQGGIGPNRRRPGGHDFARFHQTLPPKISPGEKKPGFEDPGSHKPKTTRIQRQ
jgi:hypothetical protein